MEQETVIWIKKEEPDVLPNEPGTMFLQDPLQLEQPSLHVKQEVELKLDLDGSEQKFLGDPLGGYSSTYHLNGHSGLNFGWDENEIYNAVPNTLLHTILEAESECCPPPLLVPEKELFFEDPLHNEDPGLYIKEEPELQLDVDGSEHNVVASRSYASNSTRLLQSSEMCDVPFEETISPGVRHSDLEKGSEEATSITVFHEGEEVEKEVEGGEEESLAAPRLDCSWRRNKCQIFSCNFCLQSFSSKYRLVVHVFVHIAGVQPPTYVCKSCGEVFPSYVSLKKHLKFSEADQESSPDKEETFDCCGAHGSCFLQDNREDSALDQTARQCFSNETRKSFTDKCNTHIPTHNAEMRDSNDNNGTSDATGEVNASTVPHLGKRSHKCDVCGKSFTLLDNLKTHSLIHTGIPPHKCDVCVKSFRRLGDLKTHALIHTGIRFRKCDICGKSFTPRYLKIHELLHTGMLPHKCNICGKSFTSSSNLKTHTLIHTVMKPHKCGICGKSFTRLDNLKTHALIHTGSQSHKCHICEKSFPRLDVLKRHAILHTGISLQKCNVCGKYFTLRYLKKHALIHTGKLPHKCNICGKSFNLLCNLKTHSLIHSGRKSHKCDNCGKSFRRLGDLKRHALKHTGSRFHKCDICGKSFTLQYLKNHALIHTGMLPHKCNICGKSFNLLSNLKTHTLIHTGRKPHKCDICGKSFTRLDHLKRHVLLHTGITS